MKKIQQGKRTAQTMKQQKNNKYSFHSLIDNGKRDPKKDLTFLGGIFEKAIIDKLSNAQIKDPRRTYLATKKYLK